MKDREFVPIFRTLREYSWGKAFADARAAVNVALLDFPQGMAYALIAGLPVQVGIFGSTLASITGPIFASSRFIMLGPTNATAVMLLSAFLTLNYDPAQAMVAMPLLLLMVGGFMVLGSFLRIAAMVQYISRAVVVGYISAAAFLIIVNQLKNVCGLHVPRAGTFAESVYNLAVGLSATHWDSLLIAGITLAVYLPLRRWAAFLPGVAIALAVTAVAAYFLQGYGVAPELLEGISISSWPLSLPTFSGFEFDELANTALAVAFLSLLESSSISKTLAAQAGDRVNLNQQMFSMGVANFACAFGSGMAVSGSLTRSMLNYRSGAKTPMASVYSGVMLILGLFFLGPLIAFIPRPALAVLVIMVGISLLDREKIMVMLRTSRGDAAVFLVTFIGGLIFPLDTAIYLGAGTSIGLFMRKAARPDLKEIAFDDRGQVRESPARLQERERPAVSIVHVEGDLFFASSEVFLDQMRHLASHPDSRVIILRLRNARHVDATASLAIMELARFAGSKDSKLLISGANEEIEKVFRGSGLLKVVGEENFFPSLPDQPLISTRNALKRAQEILGDSSPEITIFAAEKKDKETES